MNQQHGVVYNVIFNTENHHRPDISCITDPHILDHERHPTSPTLPLSATLERRRMTALHARSLRHTLPRSERDQENPSILHCLKRVLLSTYVNVLLVFIPAGIIAHFLHAPDIAVFVLNFIAIIPLAKLIDFVRTDISVRVGYSLGALLNFSFLNAAELIISIVALRDGKIAVVQSTLLGSVLSKLLLTLGLCCMVGGLKHKSLRFNMAAAQSSSALLFLSTFSMIIPSAVNSAYVLKSIPDIFGHTTIKHVSYASSFVLLATYVCYLFFQLKTHDYIYANDTENPEKPFLPLWLGIALLLLVTTGISFCAEILVGSMDGIAGSSVFSPLFISLILLPFVTNAAENVLNITIAWENDMNLVIEMVNGSSLQITMFAAPLMVLVGWIIGQEMTLLFNTFEICTLFASVYIVIHLFQLRESHWLGGAMLLGAYITVAIAIFYYPTAVNAENGNQGS